ncbi:unnamed protein product [Plutella xylostella]|uniref:(diamondback moth) hypothetical protein n=1 Tax=Plutella xylostella TaxID=51655 RepID=A0A8S4DX56_PLUXY|nr:unnamed protein product [Plutella xylostella]
MPVNFIVYAIYQNLNGLDPLEELANGEKAAPSFSNGLIEELAELFDGELKPVAPKAQKKVPMPPDLDLERWQAAGWSSDSSSSSDEEAREDATPPLFAPAAPAPRPPAQFTQDELDMLREARKAEQANNPHYLKDGSPRSYQQDDAPVAEIALEVPLQIHSESHTHTHTPRSYQQDDAPVAEIALEQDDAPVAEIALEVPLQIHSESHTHTHTPRSYQQDDAPVAELALEVPLQIHTKRSDKYLTRREDNNKKSKKPKKRKSKKAEKSILADSYSEDDDVSPTARPEVSVGGELPEGAASSDDEPPPRDEPHRALDLDLDLPLREEELLATRIQQYPLPESGQLKKTPKKKKSKKSESDQPSAKNDKKKKSKKTKKVVEEDLINTDYMIVEEGGDKPNSEQLTDQTTPVSEKRKKSKKDDKDKESKHKKPSKKDKHANKTGYEEALGISTPSKEVI